MPPESGPELTCVHAEECPACPLIALPYASQLEVKRRRVEEERARYPAIASTLVEAPVPADPRARYRTRAKLVVSGASLGLFAEGSHRVVDLAACQVQKPEIFAITSAIRDRLPASFPLRGVDLRATEQGVFVTLIVADGANELLIRELAEGLWKATPSAVGISVAHRSDRSPTVLGRAPRLLLGHERVRHRLEARGPFHFVSAGTFAQAHEGQERFIARAISERLRHSFPEGARVLDLFSGVGASALVLASEGHAVTAVEVFAPSAALCDAAAKEQSLFIRAIASDARVAVRRFLEAGEHFDAILVNPPRRGVAPGLRADLARLHPELLAYVSCEPRSLMRDAADLAGKGLLVQQFRPIDMMPQSGDVETLAFFAQGEPPLPNVLFEDEDILIVEKAAHEPVHPAIRGEPSLLGRVRRLSNAESAVPVHPMGLGTSGACWFSRRPDCVAAVRGCYSRAVMEFTALVRGIARPKGSIRRSTRTSGAPRDARTRYVRDRVLGGHSLISASCDGGDDGQTERHFASLGHPVVGDSRTGHAPTNQFMTLRHLLDRPFLHCARVTWGASGGRVQVESPLPRDLASVVETLSEPVK